MLDTKKFIHILQNKFPLVSRPFRHMATTLVIEEEEVMDYVRRMRASGIIRRIGPVYSPSAYGYQTLLSAIQTPPDAEQTVAKHLNRCPAITHNYKRSGGYNIWFTYAYRDRNEKEALFAGLKTQYGITRILELPSVRTYKLKADFAFDGLDLDGLPKASDLPESDDPFIDIPVTPTPFQVIGDKHDRLEEEIILKIMQRMETGHIKRFGAIFDHTKAGLVSNSLVAWEIPREAIDAVGEQFANEPFISHCYQRSPQPGWPYTLYTMIHAYSDDEREIRIQALIAGLKEFHIECSYLELKTLVEFKKSSFIP